MKFFNEGTTPAQNVQVAVKLDANLDPSTVEILDAEYPYTKTITGNNLAITFNNIYLPGINQSSPLATYDEAESWVRFKVCSKNVLAPICINHQAIIYFDFEQGIYTNTATTCTFCTQNNGNIALATDCQSGLAHRPNSKSKITENINLGVFPNPVYNLITFASDGSYSNVKLNITNSAGQLVKRETLNILTDGSTVDVEDLKSGIYFVQLTNEKNPKSN
ncbi:MAG: T9SS type A sorting domain-containing protein [Saprospiraceae bacterium]|nr:T9SS type A sorting domain-containing protein [Saprospiraceae bacterium]